MINGLYAVAEKIKILRDKSGITQTQLAKNLGLTRSSINGWEMGLSIPSTPYIVGLAKLFNVSTDYLLGMEETATINVKSLDENEISVVVELVNLLSKKK